MGSKNNCIGRIFHEGVKFFLQIFFLAAMSSSRSDMVTQSVRPSVLLVSLEFFLILKSSNGVSRKFKGCLKFQGCFKEVSRVFTENFKGVF